MRTLDDYVLAPRRLEGKLYAERLADGELLQIDVRAYDRTPLIYRGRQVWGHVDVIRNGIGVRELMEAVQLREQQYAVQKEGAD